MTENTTAQETKKQAVKKTRKKVALKPEPSVKAREAADLFDTDDIREVMVYELDEFTEAFLKAFMVKDIRNTVYFSAQTDAAASSMQKLMAPYQHSAHRVHYVSRDVALSDVCAEAFVVGTEKASKAFIAPNERILDYDVIVVLEIL